jgi:hypothetical protein
LLRPIMIFVGRPHQGNKHVDVKEKCSHF